jgi:RNA polymerase sigma-70 factor (ECF subfamily)
VFVLRDVLGWSAQEVADALDVSVAAANSALQRARESVERHAPSYPTSSGPTDEERAVLAAFIRTHEGADAAAFMALMSKDIRVTMPPHPACFVGHDAIAPLLERAFAREGEWRCLPRWANHQPAAVCYLRRPGDTAFRAFAIEVLRVSGGLVEEITTFDASLVAAFGCPEVLP